MDNISKAVVFGGKLRVAAIDVTETLQQLVRRHGMAEASAVALGRALVVTAFLADNIKDASEDVTVLIDGKGGVGKLLTKGVYGVGLRGFVEQPDFNCDMHRGRRQSVREAIGIDGELTVIRDLHMKEPYVGKTPLVNGEIAEDFSYYFTASQQTPSAVALDADVESGAVKRCKGIILQVMPGCTDEIITIAEDIVSNFADLSVYAKLTPQQLIERFFGHFEIEYYQGATPHFQCVCHRALFDKMLLSFGKEEALSLPDQQGNVCFCCEYCNSKYVYTEGQIRALFDAQ